MTIDNTFTNEDDLKYAAHLHKERDKYIDRHDPIGNKLWCAYNIAIFDYCAYKEIEHQQLDLYMQQQEVETKAQYELDLDIITDAMEYRR